MATGITFYSFQGNLLKGVHDFTSDSTCTLTLALTNTAPALTNTQRSHITEISYTNLSARVITGVALTNTLGVWKVTADPLTVTASGIVPTWRYAVLYDDDTTNDQLIMYWDAGLPVNMVNGQNYLFNIVNGQIGQQA